MTNRGILDHLKKITYRIILASLLVFLLRYVVLFVAFDIFRTPTNSMSPTIKPGARGIINKLNLGGRFFDIFTPQENSSFSIRRLPGFGHLQRNDIIVFNAPWTDSWDSIAMNMNLYFCKRVIALGGDTLEIRKGHYRIRGFDGMIGVLREQEAVRQYVEKLRLETKDSVLVEGSVYTIPFHPDFNWTIDEMGPMVIPTKGLSIILDYPNYILYKKYIEWETGKKLLWNNCNECRLLSSGYSPQNNEEESEIGNPVISTS